MFSFHLNLIKYNLEYFTFKKCLWLQFQRSMLNHKYYSNLCNDLPMKLSYVVCSTYLTKGQHLSKSMKKCFRYLIFLWSLLPKWHWQRSAMEKKMMPIESNWICHSNLKYKTKMGSNFTMSNNEKQDFANEVNLLWYLLTMLRSIFFTLVSLSIFIH